MMPQKAYSADYLIIQFLVNQAVVHLWPTIPCAQEQTQTVNTSLTHQ
jgi:hypothetical protein